MDLGFGHWIEGAAASGGPAVLKYEFDGEVVMSPGTSITLCCPTTPVDTTMWSTIIFAEIPLPAGWPL